MRTYPYLCRGFTASIIALLIALAFSPSIFANTQQEILEGKQVELTTEICGLPGKKPQTVQLTQEQADEVDRLFDEIKIKMDNTASREETVEMFNKAIVELDKYGLLSGLNVEQAQRLVTGKNQNLRTGKLFDKLISNPLFQYSIDNIFCLIAGNNIDIVFVSVWGLLLYRLALIINDSAYSGLLVDLVTWIIDYYNPICIGRILWYSPRSTGWVVTVGVMGKKSWDGQLIGTLPYPFYPLMRAGVRGFTGYKILFDEPDKYKYLYLGTALTVGIDSIPLES